MSESDQDWALFHPRNPLSFFKTVYELPASPLIQRTEEASP